MKNILSIFTMLSAPIWLSACGGEQSGGADGAMGSSGAMAPDTEISAERGKTVFLRCRACHMLEKGKTTGAGPSLYAIFGAKAGSKPGFSYSQAMLDSNITWDAQTMDAYLKKPQQAVKGTRMAFPGIPNDADRASLIKYLEEATK